MMLNRKKQTAHGFLTAVLVCGCLVATALAADPVWEDNFDSGSRWVTQYGTIEAVAQDGKYTVENKGANIAVLKSDQDHSNFTYSVTLQMLSEKFNYTGILFCWSNNFEGYVFTIADNKQWALQKMVRTGDATATETILTGINGFISTSTNIIKASKSGTTITLFCNGVYLGQATDTKFNHGYIGLVVNAGEKVAYDYASIHSEPATGAPLKYFRDDFDDNELTGWYTKQAAGTVTCKDGVLEISAGVNRRQSIVLTNGDYNQGPVKVIATKKGGSASGFYGLVRMAYQPDGNFDALVYTISRDRKRAVYLLSTRQPIEYSLVPASAINDLDTDTLEIGGPPDYQFFVNGQKLPEINFGTVPAGLNFNVVGLISDSSVTVEFDNFVAGDSTQTSVRTPRKQVALRPVNPTYMLGGAGILVDPRGRIVRQLNDTDADMLRHLGNGQYFVVPNQNQTGKQSVHRAIIVK